MSEPALSASELLQWNDQTAQRWKTLLTARPEALELPCNIYGVKDVRGLLHHIYAVETRYQQRLSGEAISSYEEVPDRPLEALFTVHDAAAAKYRALLADSTIDWEETMEFTTISVGKLSATKRKILFHSLLHSIRHYAQLATLVRQHGIKPGWSMDFLYSEIGM